MPRLLGGTQRGDGQRLVMTAEALAVLDVARGALIEPFESALDGLAHGVGGGGARGGDEKNEDGNRGRTHGILGHGCCA